MNPVPTQFGVSHGHTARSGIQYHPDVFDRLDFNALSLGYTGTSPDLSSRRSPEPVEPRAALRVCPAGIHVRLLNAIFRERILATRSVIRPIPRDHRSRKQALLVSLRVVRCDGIISLCIARVQ
jgi:hypothetical protein